MQNAFAHEKVFVSPMGQRLDDFKALRFNELQSEDINDALDAQTLLLRQFVSNKQD